MKHHRYQTMLLLLQLQQNVPSVPQRRRFPPGPTRQFRIDSVSCWNTRICCTRGKLGRRLHSKYVVKCSNYAFVSCSSASLISQYSLQQKPHSSWITLEQGKTTADAMGDVWRGLEVVEAATRVGSEMLVCNSISIITQIAIQRSALLSYSYSVSSHAKRISFPFCMISHHTRAIHCKIYPMDWILFPTGCHWECALALVRKSFRLPRLTFHVQ